MKPGGRVCFLDWVKLDAFDLSNPQIADMYQRCKLLIGAVYTPSVNDFLNALKAAGFNIVWHGTSSTLASMVISIRWWNVLTSSS